MTVGRLNQGQYIVKSIWRTYVWLEIMGPPLIQGVAKTTNIKTNKLLRWAFFISLNIYMERFDNFVFICFVKVKLLFHCFISIRTIFSVIFGKKNIMLQGRLSLTFLADSLQCTDSFLNTIWDSVINSIEIAMWPFKSGNSFLSDTRKKSSVT